MTEISLIFLDLNGVLYHCDREARLHALASTSHLSPAAIKAAIWDSGFEDRAGAFDAEAYLRGFGAAIGRDLSETEWVTALRAAIAPIPAALALVRPIRNRASRSELAIVRSAAQSFQCTLISLAVSQLCDGMNS
jgi:glucose-1-phosphatase